MKKGLFMPFAGIAALIGGIIWMLKGGELAMLPSGNPEIQVYRSSQSFMPWLGCGLAFIGIALAGLYRSLSVKTSFQRWTFLLAFLGCFLYLFGTWSRMFMNLSVQYEPVQPVGFLMAFAGMLLFGLSLLRNKILPLWIGVLIIAGSLCLLLFNDQFITAWSSVPFGVVWVALGLYQWGGKGLKAQG